ncbi:hypothetical protein WME98_28950 [Sorangium sp. So ce296]|uniref:Uncharacterized protein n=1 Tax=Sorangium cellulosum TaxID=56 RepID=A0A150SKY1_SORCE|nr:hypothetical protein BE18_22020 [Sorangium cellulosum]KYF93112.1 hypothetical protein BE20_01255 [Sorangium cellulosum]
MSYANPKHPTLSFLYALYSNDTAEKQRIRNNPKPAYKEYSLSAKAANICNKVGLQPGAKPTAELADEICVLVRQELIRVPDRLMYDTRYVTHQSPMQGLLYAVYAGDGGSSSRKPFDGGVQIHFPGTEVAVAALASPGNGKELSHSQLNAILAVVKAELLGPVYSAW